MQKKDIISNSITEGPIIKGLLSFFFPLLLGIFFQYLYNTVDAIILGQFVGKQALSAVGSSTAALINLTVGFFVGVASGATVIISQLYGAKDAKGTHRAVHTAFALAIVGGIVLLILGITLAYPALKLMGTPDDILPLAVTYMRIYFSGIIFNLLYNIGSGVLRAVGDSKRPLYFLIISIILNLVLDIILVTKFDLGVAGVGIATIFAQAVSAVLVIICLLKANSTYKLILKEIHFDIDTLKKIVRIGIPAGVQSSIYSISNIIIVSTFNSFGTNAISSWAATSKIDTIFWMIIQAFGISITTFAGQNFGAERYDRVKKSTRICLLIASVTTIFVSSTLLLLSKYALSIFTKDQYVISTGRYLLFCMAPYYITYVCVEIFSGTIRGCGESFIPMLITCVGVCVIRIGWILLVVPKHHTLFMVTVNYPISWSITSLIFIIYYLKGGWLKRCINKSKIQN